MYTIVHVGIVFLFIIALLYLSRKQIIRFKHRITYVILFIGFIMIISAFPIENFIYTFKSPEEAYEYLYSKTTLKTFDGKNSTLALPVEDENDSPQEFFIKVENGWKLKTVNSCKTIVQGSFDSALVQIIKCNGDYYVTVASMDGINISDNKNSSYFCEKQSIATYALAYVEDITDYALIIDGKRIQIT